MSLIGRRREPLRLEEIGAVALVSDASSGESSNTSCCRPFCGRRRIDCLIGCAGGMGVGRVTDMSDAQWQGALDSNLNSAFASARACLPELVKTGGNLLFVASIASLAAGRRYAAT